MRYIALAILLLAFNSSAADYSHYLDPVPVESKNNKIHWFKECSEISHFSGRDYIVFRWHDKATLCGSPPRASVCYAVGPNEYIAIRLGCIERWRRR